MCWETLKKKYFEPFYDSKGILTVVKEKDDVIKRELQLCGYFCIVTSDKMTASEAIDLYYSRDASEIFSAEKNRTWEIKAREIITMNRQMPGSLLNSSR